MQRRKQRAAGFAVLVCLIGMAFGCRQETPPLFRRNQPPETFATILPADSAQGYYRYHVYWRGEDADGRVVRFLFAITDTISRNEEENWDPQIASDRIRGTFTTKSDSIFIFDSKRGRQSFNIVAIDDYGRMDPTPSRHYFRVVDNGLPRVVFIDVQSARTGIPPCTAESCTVSTYTNFAVRFTGTTRNGGITGYQWWSSALSGIQPFGTEKQFLRGGRDTLATDSEGKTLWTMRHDARTGRDTITVYFESNRSRPLASGKVSLSARVRDDANQASVDRASSKLVVVNHDPHTEWYRIAPCDCPHPRPGCAGGDSVRAGWITGRYDTTYAPSQWRRFCEDDTIPIGSVVRFFAKGWDDFRDVARDSIKGLEEVGFAFNYDCEIRGEDGSVLWSNRGMPLSSRYPTATFQLPDGRTWHGAATPPSWKACPFDFKVYAAALDEQGRADGKPAAMRFYVGGSPVIDSLQVDTLVVFVPRCRGMVCGDPPVPNFGPGTATIVGRFRAASDSITCAPPLCGLNEFVLPYTVWGHDWPKDRTGGGAIRTWIYDLECLSGECGGPTLPGAGDRGVADQSREWDPPGQQVLDSLRIVFPMNTVFVPPATIEPRLEGSGFASYLFTVKGRDTAPLGEECKMVSSLDPNARELANGISEFGRRTQILKRTTRWVQISQMRGASAVPSTPPGPLGNRKRLMR